MQRKIFLIATLIAISFATFSHNSHAQTAKKRPQAITPEERDKREVKKFVRSFTKSLEETKDLDQVPDKFFVSDFKTRFSQSEEWAMNEDIFIKLSSAERYDHNSLWVNFLYLAMMWNGGSEHFVFDEEDEENESDEEGRDKFFPSPVFHLVKQNKTLCKILDIDTCDDYEIKDADELISSIIEMRQIVELQQKYVAEMSLDSKSKYEKNIAKARKRFKGYNTEICDGEKDCKGFPQGSRIYDIAVFPFYLRLVKENGAFKIFDIVLLTD